MPDTRSRLHVVENLWKKTAGALVFLEHGSKAGFAAVMEARNFVLQVSRRQLDPLERQRILRQDQASGGGTSNGELTQRLARTEGSVVAPCPHDYICPRVSELLAKSFCNFSACYKVFDIGQTVSVKISLPLFASN